VKYREVAEAAYIVSQSPEGQKLLEWLDADTDVPLDKKDSNKSIDSHAMAMGVGERRRYLKIKRLINDGKQYRTA
jgi:hypothetical protein